MSATATKAAPASVAAGELAIEFMFLDLTTCERCLGTDKSLEEALELTRQVLAATGVTVTVSKIHVTSAEQASELRFVSSPTIRVNGQDVALELRESSCGSEACTDGCGDSVNCRVWAYRGQEYTEPPVPMVVEAILRQVYGGTGAGPAEAAAAASGPARAQGYELPENLARFFAGKESAADGAACCGPAEQQACCEPGEKDACCGAPAGAAPGGTCGCK